MDDIVFDEQLTKADRLVLKALADDLREHSSATKHAKGRDDATIATLSAINDPKDAHFEPTVFNGFDLGSIRLPPFLDAWLLRPYIRMARSVVRVETDVVMLNHLLLYFATSVPSAAFLFWRFSWLHGLLHMVMQGSYMGPYTLMMHQHIHQRGILAKRFSLIDTIFPYITDPLMGHTWNSYYYHHIKHHHVEGNGPDDLSSTIRYQRDDIFHFLHYVGRFFFLIWLDLPLYFARKGRTSLAVKAGFWEGATYVTLYALYRLNPRAALCVVLLPLFCMRIALMTGNWGQHAFVDDEEPDSDYRSSITVIDVVSNRHCFNDGYHTSHHLNPLRHWREHPVSFLKSKDTYASQNALVFHNIDYMMITIRLLRKDYKTLAKCMVPIGNQISMTLDERAAFLKRHTRRFTEEEIRKKFSKK
ncbi:hypothetical protein MFIFM68171_04824 [Madurella fahalii]|uniref:Fatty acid desaturase domain-containing protein n=1 Tax=Madurella fahalii TaxID=1157608 RepID=A0ABQ0GA66_9PEZI